MAHDGGSGGAILDVPALAAQIVAILRSNAGTLWAKVEEIASEQALAVAMQAKLVAETKASGDSSEILVKFLSDQQERMALTLVRFVVAETVATFEKTWNAVVDLIWKTVDGAVNRSLGLI